MKKQILLIALFVAASFGFAANAQVSVHFNIGLQPLWGPVGYDYVEYYYLPDIDAYYDVPNQVYVYYDGGQWVRRNYLPPRYANYDMYRSYKVVVNQPSPWLHHNTYRSRYAGYRGRGGQEVIRDSRQERYWENPNHPQHGYWHGRGHDNGRHEGHEGRYNEGRRDEGRHDEGHHGGESHGEGRHDNGHHGR